MSIKFYIDPETDEPHLLRHGVRPEEAVEVLESPAEIRTGYDGAYIAIGQSEGGRYLRVVYLLDD